MAAAWKVGVVFVVENNLYGEYRPLRETTPLDDLADRAKAYAIPGVIVDGQDVDAVHAAVTDAIARGASGRRPDAARDEDLPLPRPLAHRSRRSTGPRASSTAGRSATRSTSSAQSSPRRECCRPTIRQRFATEVAAARRRTRRAGRSRRRSRRSRRFGTMSTQLESTLDADGDRRRRDDATVRRSTRLCTTSWQLIRRSI